MFIGSPFHATVTETATESPAAKVRCYGAGLQPNAVRKGQKAVFTVDASASPQPDAPVNVTTTNLNTGRLHCDTDAFKCFFKCFTETTVRPQLYSKTRYTKSS